MKLLRCTLLLALCTVAGFAMAHEEAPHAHAPPQVLSEADGVRTYGAAVPDAPPALALATVLQAPEGHLGKAIKVEGRIGQVCQQAGCWMTLTDGEQGVRVVFGDHAFSLPTDTQGHAVVYGTLEQKQISADMARHLAEDAGQDPAQAGGARTEYRMVAQAVAVRP